ncbi:MAG: 1,4-dihydroxy-2-naphthoate polyprenyltransferase [Rhodothermaceae bacterium]|nr:1,4-dihydroxy-2-naphthoate polyprenyltransferase [Rhodothermaceae bacterium]MXZ58862.1 1,4-dihydroxy-2-naphthoate polyprenyltransferase [Rhodothermaceae bacterium]MYB89986.1 1,4-dihydroxy-2-naphthoate polyprenyltransferase [Rhodothermaceae bacterium]MYD68450.1 1,4-dihydroxy-2-naphthoate polyprenyltransferase [Rhodothermaceae bacterium]MYG43727.1 1,4-dihydroxy-2-naphthoate polyprenyltransferase [Rhodothermaceae bacterium]
MNGSPVRAWVLASRPKTLPVAIAPVLVGSAMAWDDGIFNIGIALITVVCALLITIGTNLCNDYADFMSGVDTTNRKGPTRVTQAGLIAAQHVLVATVLVYCIATALGMILVYRGGWGVSIIGFASILAGILYTAGPWPYGYKGLGDLFVLIFFGPVAVGGTYYVQTLEITLSVIIIGLAPGLLSVAILTVNNIRDIVEDRKANKKTLVVRFGRKFGIGLWLGCVVIAALLPLEFVRVTGDHVWAGLTVLILIPAISILHKLITIHDSTDLNPLLGQTAFLLLGYSVIFALFW